MRLYFSEQNYYLFVYQINLKFLTKFYKKKNTNNEK